MARIKSALELALEKTQDIEIDETKHRADSLIKEGMALAGGYLSNTDRKIDEIAAKYVACSEEDRVQVRQGIINTIMANLNLPSDDLYQMRFERVCDITRLVSNNDAQAEGLMNQIGDFFRQYLDAKDAFVERMKAQIQQAMENNSGSLGSASQYTQLISQNLKKMDQQYGEALENTKQALRELLG